MQLSKDGRNILNLDDAIEANGLEIVVAPLMVQEPLLEIKSTVDTKRMIKTGGLLLRNEVLGTKRGTNNCPCAAGRDKGV